MLVRALGLGLGLLALLVASCSGSNPEADYLDKMWAWFSLEGAAPLAEPGRAMLDELSAIEAPDDWASEHELTFAAYRAYVVTYRNERQLQEIEERRFAARGAADKPNCDIDIRARLNYISAGYDAACQAIAVAESTWHEQSRKWTAGHLEERIGRYDLRAEARSLIGARLRLGNEAGLILRRLVEVARDEG